MYKNHHYDYCLPAEYSVENLFPEIRESIAAYFSRNESKWHDAIHRNPSNHMCDSQVCCANFLFPFADKPAALAALLRSEYPELNQMLPIEDNYFVAFEWIGKKNYLRELSRNGKRSRGANYTSAGVRPKIGWRNSATTSRRNQSTELARGYSMLDPATMSTASIPASDS